MYGRIVPPLYLPRELRLPPERPLLLPERPLLLPERLPYPERPLRLVKCPLESRA